MLKKVLIKIDVFVPIFIAVSALLAVVVVFTFQRVFSAITQTTEIEQEITDSQLKIDKNKLSEAYNILIDESVVSLEIK